MSDHQEVRLIRVEDKIDKIGDRLGSIDVTLASQHECLKEHMKRTNQLEERVMPIEKHVVMVAAALKIFGAIIIGVGLFASIAEILNYLRK